MAIAVSVVLVVLAVGIILQETRMRRETVTERLQLADAVAMLPQGVVVSPRAMLEIPDVPQSSYVIGYAKDNQAYAGFIKWDREAGRYVLAGETELGAGTDRLLGAPEFEKLPMGSGQPLAILARGAVNGAANGMMVVVPKGNAWIIATKVGDAGMAGPAFFTNIISETYAEQTAFGDVNGDGSVDAVTTVTQSPEGKRPEKAAYAFAWREGKFAFDHDLSAVLTTSARVFPDPSDAPTAAESAP